MTTQDHISQAQVELVKASEMQAGAERLTGQDAYKKNQTALNAMHEARENILLGMRQLEERMTG